METDFVVREICYTLVHLKYIKYITLYFFKNIVKCFLQSVNSFKIVFYLINFYIYKIGIQ